VGQAEGDRIDGKDVFEMSHLRQRRVTACVLSIARQWTFEIQSGDKDHLNLITLNSAKD
jgi:hypothetical protein